MSRYEFRHGMHEVAVGWDPAFRTFFAQVAPSLDCNSFELVLWVGAFGQEVKLVEELERALAAADIPLPQELAEQLRQDWLLSNAVLG